MADAALEAEIAGHLTAGDTAAAATVALKGLGPQILGLLGTTLRDDAAAFDVFSQFSEELWKSIGTFRGESAFTTWTYRLVLNAIGRFRRDPYRRRAQPLEASAVSALVQQVRDVTPLYKRTDVKDRFARLREQLDADEQMLLFLRVDQDLAWTDVAAIVSEAGTPVEVSTLRKRFERAKTKLKELAQRDGLLDP